MDKLRELPPRTTNREPLSRLERLAILNGFRGGLSTSRIATQWSMSDKTVQRLKGRIYAEPLSFYSMTRRYTTYNPLLPFLSAPFSTPISNSRCCPSPSQALPRPSRDQLLRHLLSRLGIDIEQSTAVWVLAPWAEFYPHSVSRQLMAPLRRLFTAGLAPFRRIHSSKV